MRNMTIGLAAVSVLAFASAASAQQAQYSPKDIIDTFKKAPLAATGECEKRGMATGDDGVCEPLKNSRGFSLPTRANLHAPAPVAAAPASAPAHPTVRTARVASTTTTTTVTTSPARAARPARGRDLLITFQLGSAELTDQAKANASVFAQALNSPALADGKFDISGYTDASGDKDKNLALSQARAAAVKDFLVAKGVSESRMVAQGFGATDFAVQANPMAAGNRRVEARRTD